MKAIKLLLSMVLFLLIGCTAVTSTEELDETAVPPATTIPEEQPMSEEDTPETEPIVQPDPTPTEDGKQVSEPVTVDLSNLTPVPLDSTPIVQPAPGNPGIKDPVAQAMTDLSQRLSVEMDDIELVSLREVTWRDGSLGCPQAGMAYTQALVAGQQMILTVNGEDYHYHSGKDGIFEYCSDPAPPLESMPANPIQPIPGQDD
jgi:hypothetical protein